MLLFWFLFGRLGCLVGSDDEFGVAGGVWLSS